MHVTAVSPYGNGGASSRVRVHEWLSRLGSPSETFSYMGGNNNGVKTLVRQPGALIRAERGLRELERAPLDVVLLSREASPFSHGGVEQTLLRRARWGVYDFDDTLQWDTGRGSAVRRLIPKHSKCRTCVSAADRVIAGNAMLATWAATWASDVVIIPTCVEPDAYLRPVDYAVRDVPRIGWIGSPSTEVHLQSIAAPLLGVHRRLGARLAVISRGSASFGPLDQMVDRTDWNPYRFPSDLASFDVAVAPLTDSLLARGKCAYKILQYGAAGLPCVGSPVGANLEVLTSLGAAIARTDTDWEDTLMFLLTARSSTRRAIGDAARRAVETGYSYNAWEPAMARALGLS